MIQEYSHLLNFFGGKFQSGRKTYVSVLGEAHIYIIKALGIIAETGGSITCTLSDHRRWKVKNMDCSCESINLSKACKSFLKDYEDRQEGRLT
jgi:hypothetical protein